MIQRDSNPVTPVQLIKYFSNNASCWKNSTFILNIKLSHNIIHTAKAIRNNQLQISLTMDNFYDQYTIGRTHFSNL